VLRVRRNLLALVVAMGGVVAACADPEVPQGADETTTTISAVSEVGRRRPWDGLILPPDVGDGYATTSTELAQLAELGAPNVSVVVPLVQDDPSGVPHRAPDETPTDTALVRLMRAAAELELGVVIQLRVEVAGNPGAVPTPADPELWFHHYARLATHYASLAERHGASLLVIGAMPGRVMADEARWRAVVADVRRRYAGPLAFTVDPADIDRLALWEEVDVIGIDVTLPPQPDVDEPVAADLERAWEPVLAELSALAETWTRPVVLTRVGFPGIEPSAADPTEAEVDQQLNAYEALFTVVNQTPAVEGVLVWRWGEPTPVGEASYSPEGRPAEEVLRRAWTTPLADEDDPTETETETESGTEAGTGTGTGSGTGTGTGSGSGTETGTGTEVGDGSAGGT
jgi:hypothetical protein